MRILMSGMSWLSILFRKSFTKVNSKTASASCRWWQWQKHVSAEWSAVSAGQQWLPCLTQRLHSVQCSVLQLSSSMRCVPGKRWTVFGTLPYWRCKTASVTATVVVVAFQQFAAQLTALSFPLLLPLFLFFQWPWLCLNAPNLPVRYSGWLSSQHKTLRWSTLTKCCPVLLLLFAAAVFPNATMLLLVRKDHRT